MAWNTELTEPDDLELLKITANNPSTHSAITQRVHMMGHVSSFFAGLSLVGWLILTCALIDIARTIGLQGWQTVENASYNGIYNNNGVTNSDYAFSGANRLGDPIVAGNWYWLTLCLGITLCASSYSSYRRSRGIIGGALLLSILSALQWLSFFVYMCRRVKEQGLQRQHRGQPHLRASTTPSTPSMRRWPARASSPSLRSSARWCCWTRYMTYMMVTKLDHDRVHIPSHVDAPTVIQAERDNYNPNYARQLRRDCHHQPPAGLHHRPPDPRPQPRH